MKYLGKYGTMLHDNKHEFTCRGLFMVTCGPSMEKRDAFESARGLIERYTIIKYLEFRSLI